MPTHNHAITQTPHAHPPSGTSTVFRAGFGGGSSGIATANNGQTNTQITLTGTANASITLADAGSGSAHNNIPPVAGVYFIIHVE
jgi:hypothetical protein